MALLRLYLRDLFWLVVVVSLILGWWKTYQALDVERERLNSLETRLNATWRRMEDGRIEVLNKKVRQLEMTNLELEVEKQELIHRLVTE
jgi:hypothetical protein